MLRRAAIIRSHLPGTVLGEATPLCGLVDDRNIVSPTALAADAQAGIGPDDLHPVECQDTDAARELLAYEELSLCRPGDNAALARSSRSRLGGARPINVSRGLLSKGEPLGASALGQVVELEALGRRPRALSGRCAAKRGIARWAGRRCCWPKRWAEEKMPPP